MTLENKNSFDSYYKIKRIVELKEISSVYYELEHIKTGAFHIHIKNDDKENTFGVSFKTVPSDSTGVAHILEHTVLCGSEKYPVRDPFFSMIKRSLSSFMNALTSSDWTMYPFSTQNKKDFFNLMDVYLDAVFFPNLAESSFKQEGYRIEIEEKTKEHISLNYKGVVFNEMKGVMSSPNQIMLRSLLGAIYPDTTYGYNSGGDPIKITDLTYEQLIAFHKRYYHPSNAFFYTYGDIPLEDNLFFINEKILKKFERIDPETDVLSQKKWEKPRTFTASYPFNKNEDPLKKSQVCLSWLMADIRDTFEVLSLALLSNILIGNAASPLRKALIDSGLGSALSDGTGYDTDMKDTFFACGLKDVDKDNALNIEKIIFDVLKGLVEKGIDKDLIDSAIHQIEFHKKEITNHPYPYGLKLLFNFSGTWFHGGDPARVISLDIDLNRINDEIKKGNFFENQIKKYFLDNNHRVLFTLEPDKFLEERENKVIKDKLDAIKSSLSESAIEKIIKEAESLKHLQEEKDNVSCLPTLEIKDIPPDIRIVKENHYDRYPEISSCYEQPTSGIFYFTGLLGVGNIPVDLIPLISFFCYAFPKVGTKKTNYSDMAKKISLYTGGIGISAAALNNYESGNCIPFVSFNGKCLNRNIDKMFDITSEFLLDFSFSDLSRIKNLLKEYRANLESNIVNNGHRYASSLASRNFSQSLYLNEIWSGINQIKKIKNISDDLSDNNIQLISSKLENIAKIIFNKNNFKMAAIGENSALNQSCVHAESIEKNLNKDGIYGFFTPSINYDYNIMPREGWTTTSSVSFAACVFNTVRMNHKDSPALSAISKILKSLFIHREIREKGGAYGGYASYSSDDGLFSFLSYRDPHILQTLNVYNEAFNFIRDSKNYSEEDIKEAILQICSIIDKPDTPGEAAKKSFYRKIVYLSDDARKQFKENLLSLTKHEIMNAAEKYFNIGDDKKSIVVISSEEKLKSSNEKLLNNPLKLYNI